MRRSRAPLALMELTVMLLGPLGGVESTEHLAQVRLQVLEEGADEDKPLCTLTVAWQKEVGGDD